MLAATLMNAHLVSMSVPRIVFAAIQPGVIVVFASKATLVTAKLVGT